MRNEKLAKIAQNAVDKCALKQDEPFKIFVLSEQSLMPVIVAKVLQKSGRDGQVMCYEPNHQMRQVSIIQH